MNNQRMWNVLYVLLAILLFVCAFWAIRIETSHLKSLTPTNVRYYIQSFGHFAGPVYVVVYALNAITILPPMTIISLAAGLSFGKVMGAVYLYCGALLGCSLTFFISRLLRKSFIERMEKGKLKEYDEKLGKNGFAAVLFFRVLPFIPFDVINYVAGLTSLRFRDYFFGSVIGLIPGVIVAAFMGDALMRVRSRHDIVSARVAISVIGFVLLLMLPIFWKIIKDRQDKEKNKGGK